MGKKNCSFPSIRRWMEKNPWQAREVSLYGRQIRPAAFLVLCFADPLSKLSS
jgi:hypothetical protein